MEQITVKQAAEKWGVSPRRVQVLCKEGRIKGAVRWERTWMIPAHAVLPHASQRDAEQALPMPRKSPFLDMTDVYNRAGMADACTEELINNREAHSLLEAQISYRRGEIDKVYDRARFFLSKHSGFYAILGGGLLLAHCAIWRGNLDLWNEAKRHLCTAPCTTEAQREIVSLSLAITDSAIFDNKDYPEWFTSGSFEPLPPDAHPAAKVYYAKYLYMTAYAIASRQMELEGVQGLALMRILPYTLEPMITQAVVDRTVLPEICLRLACAVAYRNAGKKEMADRHLKLAVSMALADRLYGVLAEHVRFFDGYLEERIALIDPIAAQRVHELHETWSQGWAKLSGAVRHRNIAVNLSAREREISKLFAFGFTTPEIAEMLYLSESTIKQTVLRVVQKTGIRDRSQLHTIL